MKNPVAKHMYKTSRSSVMVDRKKQSKIDPDTEEAIMLLDEIEKIIHKAVNRDIERGKENGNDEN